MRIKEIAKNSIWFGVIPYLSEFVGLLMLPLITPYLSQQDYGLWGIISAYTGLITGFVTLGLHIHLTNSYYEYRSRFHVIWSRIFYWILWGAILGFFISVGLIYSELPSTEPYNKLFVALIASVPILVSPNKSLAESYYGVRLLPRPLVLRQLISSICKVVTLFSVVHFFQMGFMGWVISATVAAIIQFSLFIKPLWINLKIFPAYNKFDNRVKDWFKLSLPIIAHSVGHVLMGNSSKIIMAVLGVAIVDIGIYTNGFLMGGYVSVIILALIRSLSPVIQTTFRANNYIQMRKLLIITQGFAFLVIFAISIWMREIYLILMQNESLQVSYTVASYTCFSLAMYPTYTLLMTTATIEKQTKSILWLLFVPALVCIILNLIFIPIYGYRAAIYTVLISYWSVSIIGCYVPYFRAHMNNWLGKAEYVFMLNIICVGLLIIAQLIGAIPIVCKLIFTVIALIMILIIVYIFRQRIKQFSLSHEDVI